MDLKDIEEWGRELLHAEAAKRGVKNPEVYSTPALVQLILKRDYGAPRNVREAARLIGGILGSAKSVLRAKLKESRGSGVKTYQGAARERAARGWSADRRADFGASDYERDRQRGGAEFGGRDDERDGDEKLDRTDSAARDELGASERDGGGLSALDDRREHEAFDAPIHERTSDRMPAETHVRGSARDRDDGGEFDGHVHEAIISPNEGGLRGVLEAEQAALKEDARLRAEERDARRDSERVRADVRARDAERSRPEPGWHAVPIASPVPREFAGEATSAEPAARPEPTAPVTESDARETSPARKDKSDLRDLAGRDSQLTAAASTSSSERAERQIAADDSSAAGALSPWSEAQPDDPQLTAASPTGTRRPASSDSSRDSGVRPAPAGPAQSEFDADAAQPSHLRLVESPASEFTQPAPSPHDVIAQAVPEISPWTPPTAAPAPTTLGLSAAEQITYGPHPQDGLLVRWSVTPEGIERARKVLGDEGELAIRIVAVSVEPHAIVKTNVIDYGPVAGSGDWTAPLLPAEARYVSAIGLRTSTRFVSIVHAAS